MEIIQLEKGLGRCVLKASGVLRGGGVIIYPTDTLYGLGADAFSNEAVAKIYAIKGRDEEKPMHAVFADMTMAAEYAEINDEAKKLAEEFLPGALTLIVKKKKGIDSGICRGIETIGIRIPECDFCLDLARTFGQPFTATSANVAGLPPQLSVEKVIEQLGEKVERVDLVVDYGLLPLRQPTTVVNVVSRYPVVLRAGAVPVSEIMSFINH